MSTEIRFGVIGLGLMGREFASAAARWIHLSNLDVRPVLVAACDTNRRISSAIEVMTSLLRAPLGGYHRQQFCP